MAKRPPDHADGARRKLRCAIYTRKSTDEGLDQDFNSLDAQREACAAYIVSQRHEGWTPVPDRYDDGGFSGGTMDRPALKALLADVAAGAVDVIVVYKVDRLTRALPDFAKIVDVLDGAGASFVSVTQSFNTTTSMGRLTLNVLLSFAQFEREVGAERVRDKIAASKAKGMWMGGSVPLGYDLSDRKLVINQAEAATVRYIFRRYIELGSGRTLLADLDHHRIRSKVRNGRDGEATGGNRIARGALYSLLKNRLYIGEIVHKGRSYPGQHDGLIDRAQFDQVQQLLAERATARRLGTNASEPSLLAGLVTDGHGRRMSPSHAVKIGRRYRYYVSQTDGEIAASLPAWRISAPDIEGLVRNKVCAAVEDAVDQRIARGDLGSDAITALGATGAVLMSRLRTPSLSEARAALLPLVRAIQVDEQGIGIEVALAEVDPLLGSRELLTITAGIVSIRQGNRLRLVLPPPAESPSPRSPALVKLVMQASAAAQLVMSGSSLSETAAQLGLSRDYAAELLRVSYLSPTIVTAILEGRAPASLSRNQLVQARHVPLDWDEQHRLFGFS